MSDDHYYMGRQPILDLQKGIVGYELLFRAGNVTSANITDYSMACVSVIVDALSSLGFREVLGHHRGFINVNLEILMSDMLELLPNDQVVLELLESVPVNRDVIDRLRDLKSKGFSLALDDHLYDPDLDPFYPMVDIIKVDIQQISFNELPEMIAEFRRFPAVLLAEKVETVEQFKQCQELGFSLFQGFFFARPDLIRKKRIDPAGATLLRLLQQLMNDSEIHEIEETFRKSPELVHNLLKLVNSVSVGLRVKIGTLRHAILILGRSQLIRWAQLAMFACSESYGGGSTLLEMSAMRGRLVELLVQRHSSRRKDPDYQDRAFMTGILSLLDVLFSVTMEEVLSHLNLADDVRYAIQDRKGELGMFLSLVEQLEKAESSGDLPTLQKYGLNHESLLYSQLEAISWTNGLAEQF